MSITEFLKTCPDTRRGTLYVVHCYFERNGIIPTDKDWYDAFLELNSSPDFIHGIITNMDNKPVHWIAYSTIPNNHLSSGPLDTPEYDEGKLVTYMWQNDIPPTTIFEDNTKFLIHCLQYNTVDTATLVMSNVAHTVSLTT